MKTNRISTLKNVCKFEHYFRFKVKDTAERLRLTHGNNVGESNLHIDLLQNDADIEVDSCVSEMISRVSGSPFCYDFVTSDLGMKDKKFNADDYTRLGKNMSFTLMLFLYKSFNSTAKSSLRKIMAKNYYETKQNVSKNKSVSRISVITAETSNNNDIVSRPPQEIADLVDAFLANLKEPEIARKYASMIKLEEQLKKQEVFKTLTSSKRSRSPCSPLKRSRMVMDQADCLVRFFENRKSSPTRNVPNSFIVADLFKSTLDHQDSSNSNKSEERTYERYRTPIGIQATNEIKRENKRMPICNTLKDSNYELVDKRVPDQPKKFEYKYQHNISALAYSKETGIYRLASEPQTQPNIPMNSCKEPGSLPNNYHFGLHMISDTEPPQITVQDHIEYQNNQQAAVSSKFLSSVKMAKDSNKFPVALTTDLGTRLKKPILRSRGDTKRKLDKANTCNFEGTQFMRFKDPISNQSNLDINKDDKENQPPQIARKANNHIIQKGNLTNATSRESSEGPVRQSLKPIQLENLIDDQKANLKRVSKSSRITSQDQSIDTYSIVTKGDHQPESQLLKLFKKAKATENSAEAHTKDLPQPESIATLRRISKGHINVNQRTSNLNSLGFEKPLKTSTDQASFRPKAAKSHRSYPRSVETSIRQVNEDFKRIKNRNAHSRESSLTRVNPVYEKESSGITKIKVTSSSGTGVVHNLSDQIKKNNVAGRKMTLQDFFSSQEGRATREGSIEPDSFVSSNEVSKRAAKEAKLLNRNDHSNVFAPQVSNVYIGAEANPLPKRKEIPPIAKKVWTSDRQGNGNVVRLNGYNIIFSKKHNNPFHMNYSRGSTLQLNSTFGATGFGHRRSSTVGSAAHSEDNKNSSCDRYAKIEKSEIFRREVTENALVTSLNNTQKSICSNALRRTAVQFDGKLRSDIMSCRRSPTNIGKSKERQVVLSMFLADTKIKPIKIVASESMKPKKAIVVDKKEAAIPQNNYNQASEGADYWANQTTQCFTNKPAEKSTFQE